ncbi:MAG: glycosyltransferase [Planctomycetes bacterium]|nr:glycosyltransferase [Planctomycetota bacterium]
MRAPDLTDFDFLDFGASTGSSIEFACKHLGGRRGLGVDLDPNKVETMRRCGYDCIQADATKLELPPNAVKFVLMSHFLEHLPDLDSVRKSIRSAARVATDFIAIRGPYFDADEYLRGLGIKFYWSDWTGHLCHLTTMALAEIMRAEGLKDVRIECEREVADSNDPALLPLAAPADQHAYDPQFHGEKPQVQFNRKVYAEIVAVAALRPQVDVRAVLNAMGSRGKPISRLAWLPRNVYRTSKYFLVRRRRPVGSLLEQAADEVRRSGLRSLARRSREHINRLLGIPLEPAAIKSGFCLFVTASPPVVKGYSSGSYRCGHASEQLASLGLPSAVSAYEGIDLMAAIRGFDCFVLHRLPWDGEVEKFIRSARKAGKPVVYDADDLVFEPSVLPNIRERARMDVAKRTRFDEYVGRRNRIFRLCDAGIVSTDYLAEQTRRFIQGIPVYVNRNTVSNRMLALSEETLSNKPPMPTIAYFSGTRSHDVDFVECADALSRVMEMRPAAELLLVGPLVIPDSILRFRARIRRRPVQPWPVLAGMYRSTWINLAPLERESVFAGCKSALKYFEAGLFAVPTVASACPAFDQDIRDGENGFLCRSAAEWEDKILRLIDDSELRSRIGRAARAHVHAEYVPQARAENLERIWSEIFGVERFKAIREKHRTGEGSHAR